MIRIDGSRGEGGGQVLRTALAVAVARGTAFTLDDVRANRKPPGLKAQHLTCVLAAGRLAGARLEGAEQGSRRVAFEPAHPAPAGRHRFEIGTAGATGLLLHALAFPLWLAGAPSEVVLTGGTHVEHAPGYDYLEIAWAPALALAGFPGALALVTPGFYPRGGGEVRASLEPAAPRPLELGAAGRPLRVRVVARSAGLPPHVGERLVGRVRERLEKRLAVPTEGRHVEGRTRSPGCAVTAVLELEGGGRIAAQGLGERGKPAERVADEVADAILADHRAGGSVDEHLADQLLVPLALGAGGSFVTPRVSDHLTTNAGVLALVLPEARVAIEPFPDGSAARVLVVGARAAR